MQLYVGNLSYSTSEDTLKELFSQFGEVKAVKIITDRDTGRSKGFGFVEMESQEIGKDAMSQLNGREVDGRNLRVNEAQRRESSGRSSRY